jgi:hypothetical protein
MAKIIIKKDLQKDINEFCELNKIDVNEWVNSLLQEKLLSLKYKQTPFFTNEENLENKKEDVKEDLKLNNNESKYKDLYD